MCSTLPFIKTLIDKIRTIWLRRTFTAPPSSSSDSELELSMMGALQSSTSDICRTSSAFSMIGAGVVFLSGAVLSSSPPFSSSFYSSSSFSSSCLSSLARASVPLVASVFSSSVFFSSLSPCSAPSSTFFSLFFRGVPPDHDEEE